MRLNNKGQLLLEALITISILVIVVMFGSQLFLTSARSSKWSRERDVAGGLAEETLEIVRSAASENWLTIYKPPDGTGNQATGKGAANFFHQLQLSGKWALTSGNEVVTVNGLSYTRYFTIDNVSRDQAIGNIETSYNSTDDDPSTQRITVSVSWPNGDTVTTSEFVTRWKNKVTTQSDWTTSGSSDSNIDSSTAGSLKLKSQ